ncbi:MAG: MBL fold metallo-hydrolase [Promethearchaeota archaeon]
MKLILKEGKFNENDYLSDSLQYGLNGNMACFLVKGTKKKVLIDAAGFNEAEKLFDKLKQMDLIPDILILTHSHWDHAAGTSIIREKIPNIKVLASHLGIGSLEKISEFNKAFSGIPSGPPIENVTPIKDGDIIDLGGLKLTIFETPGHSNCSISILDNLNKVLFVGDSIGDLIGNNRIIFPPLMPPEFSEEKLFSTIDKIKNIDYSALGLAHFGFLIGEDAQNFPEKIRSAYKSWKDFFVSNWKQKPSKENIVEKLKIKFEKIGITGIQRDFIAHNFGDWCIEALKSAKLI